MNRDPYRRRTTLGSLGLSGGLPRDLAVVLVALFVTYTMQFFPATRFVPAFLRLTPLVWQLGFVWQLATYPFIGWGPQPSVWFLLELLILYWFGRDVFAGLGRRHFWRLIGWCAVGGALVAVAVDALTTLTSGATGLLPELAPFPLLQGQRVMLALFVAAFATANRQAQILLFFVLPIEARWFIGIEILIGFIGYLQTRDLAGFLGLCTAIGLAYVYVRDGGIGRGLRQSRLRLQRWWLQHKLDRARRKRGLRVVPGDRPGGRDSWPN
jgi:hypothetical protein